LPDLIRKMLSQNMSGVRYHGAEQALVCSPARRQPTELIQVRSRCPEALSIYQIYQRYQRDGEVRCMRLVVAGGGQFRKEAKHARANLY